MPRNPRQKKKRCVCSKYILILHMRHLLYPLSVVQRAKSNGLLVLMKPIPSKP